MKVEFEKTFSINEKIEMYVLAEQVGAGNYKTRIADVGTDFLEIATPLSGGQYIPLKNETKILIVQIKLDAIYMYQFNIEAVNKNKIESFIVKKLEKTKRIQRRSYFRVAYPFKMEIISCVKRVGTGIKRKYEEYLIHDISGGGISFFTYKKDNKSLFKMEDKYLVKVFINDTPYYFLGHIVRHQDLENKRELIAIIIDEINKNSREKIIRSLFIKQKELLQKGIL